MIFRIAFLSLIAFSCSNDEPVADDDTGGGDNDGLVDAPGNDVTVTTSDFITTIQETPISGQVLGKVEGTTSSGSVVFAIASEDVAGGLAVDATTGELTISDTSLFDYEVRTTFSAEVEVSNGDVKETSKVSIDIEDLEYEVYERVKIVELPAASSTSNTTLFTDFISNGIDSSGDFYTTELIYKSEAGNYFLSYTDFQSDDFSTQVAVGTSEAQIAGNYYNFIIRSVYMSSIPEAETEISYYRYIVRITE